MLQPAPAIGLRPNVGDDIATERLVAPFSFQCQRAGLGILCTGPFRETDPGLITFRDWQRAAFHENAAELTG
jgi:hypothetical protein